MMTFHPVKTLALVACLACGAGPFAPRAEAQARFDFATTPGNLVKTVVPSRYALSLDLDPERDTFTGQADLHIDVREPVAAVVLHARDLEASQVELEALAKGGARNSGKRSLQVGPGPIPQSWTLAPADATPIAKGRYLLHIAYSGKVNRSGVGLFVAQATVDGQVQHMLATQLESTDARSVFPGFDEPSFRAVFELTVRAPQGLAVAANMPQASEHADGDAVVHRFRPTPPMPSYLVAVSVGRHDTLSGTADGIPLRIFTAPGKRLQASYAMQVTKEVVPFYNAYFGVPYALPKLDQQAVPSTRSGAMEDWGLISYTETAILFDPAKSSPRTQRGVYNTMAHEIAHQWFGDLVTAASWEEIWLNEAFATWMASKATAHFNPGWHTDLEQRGPIDYTMTGDAGPATRAIRSGPVTEASVFDVFDNITYIKGGAVLGMLEQWLGEDNFRRGLSAYMRDRKFSNATAGDLWFHMGQAAQRDVAAVAASWTDQKGFPLLQVSAECSGAGAGKTTQVTISQRRFSDGAGAPAASADTSLWQVPVRLARGTELTTVMLATERQTFSLPGCRSVPLVANAGGAGYYRVKYAAPLADALVQQFPQLPPADQVDLLSDSFALAQAGELTMERWFELVALIPQVKGPARTTLFNLAGAGFDFLDQAMGGTPTQALVQASARGLFAPELERLGWADRPDDDAQTTRLRGGLIERLARFDDAPTVAQALQRFDDAEAGRATLPASIRSQVIVATGMHADRARFDQLMAHLKAAGGEEDRRIYAEALASGRDAQRADELLAASLGGLTTPNIAMSLPRLMSTDSPFADKAYAFAVEHWDALAGLAGGAMFGRYWLLPGAASGFNDTAHAARLVSDQQVKTGADGAAPAARVAAQIALMAAVQQRDAGTLQSLLSAH